MKATVSLIHSSSWFVLAIILVSANGKADLNNDIPDDYGPTNNINSTLDDIETKLSLARNQTLPPPIPMLFGFFPKFQRDEQEQGPHHHHHDHQVEEKKVDVEQLDEEEENETNGGGDHQMVMMMLVNGSAAADDNAGADQKNDSDVHQPDTTNGHVIGWREIHVFDIILRKRIIGIMDFGLGRIYGKNDQHPQPLDPEAREFVASDGENDAASQTPEHRQCLQQCSELYQKCLAQFIEVKFKRYQELKSAAGNHTTDSVVVPDSFLVYMMSLPAEERFDLVIRRNEKACFDKCDRDWSLVLGMSRKTFLGCIRAMMGNFLSMHIFWLLLFIGSLILVMLVLTCTMEFLQDVFILEDDSDHHQYPKPPHYYRHHKRQNQGYYRHQQQPPFPEVNKRKMDAGDVAINGRSSFSSMPGGDL